MTVDEILAGHEYLDRRGRTWVEAIGAAFGDWGTWLGPKRQSITTDEMRLLVERDLHRAVCEGLRTCVDHPVPHVVSYLRQAGVIQAYPADRNHGDQRSSVHRRLPEAMDAARVLAVGE